MLKSFQKADVVTVEKPAANIKVTDLAPADGHEDCPQGSGCVDPVPVLLGHPGQGVPVLGLHIHLLDVVHLRPESVVVLEREKMRQVWI